MEEHDLNTLDKLVENRKKARAQDQMGFVYALWGIYITLGMGVFAFVWSDPVFWFFWVPSGVLIQTIFLRGVIASSFHRPIWDRMIIPNIWTFALLFLPFLIVVFPFMLHVYKPVLIFPTISIWIGITMYVDGSFSKTYPVMFGALVWLVMAPLHLLFPQNSMILNSVCCIVGLSLPGFWSMYEERK